MPYTHLVPSLFARSDYPPNVHSTAIIVSVCVNILGELGAESSPLLCLVRPSTILLIHMFSSYPELEARYGFSVLRTVVNGDE